VGKGSFDFSNSTTVKNGEGLKWGPGQNFKPRYILFYTRQNLMFGVYEYVSEDAQLSGTITKLTDLSFPRWPPKLAGKRICVFICCIGNSAAFHKQLVILLCKINPSRFFICDNGDVFKKS
jgi:hypothetical protein